MTINFRTQVLIFAFLFALVPLALAVAINLPLVLDRTEWFFRSAHLQHLRADFRDLDEHLASRHELIRFLAKLPEPGSVLGDQDMSQDEIDLARARYTEWINRVLSEQLDTIQICFLDGEGHERFWLERDATTGQWRPTTRLPERPLEAFIQSALVLKPGEVLVSPISIDSAAGSDDPRRLMTLRIVTPIEGHDPETPQGLVVISIDAGGMARFYRNTLWVHDNGAFLNYGAEGAPTGNAFERYPGLQALFAGGKAALWDQGSERMIWVPLFRTERFGPLWVGRTVDTSPMADFRNALILRVGAIVLLLVVGIWIGARWLADRVARLNLELKEGIREVLEEEREVAFEWQGPAEMKQLGHDLGLLAARHCENTRTLRAHARKLEESNRYKSQFLANVSHELRTPLNSILLLSKMLASETDLLAPQQLEQARVIHQAGRDLQSLIDNILDLSRIESGRINLNLEEVDLPTLLREVIELIGPQFQAKGLPLRLSIAADAPVAVQTDGEKLRQIVKNFLSNALKFTAAGEVVLRLEPVSGDAACPCPVAIRVRDTGIGIPEAKHGRIFEAFRQADGSTSRRYGGTGLGLAISRQLAQLLGGVIELESREGEGSTFSLLLPLLFDRSHLAEGQLDETDATEEERPDAMPEASFQGHTVLVIDRDVNDLLSLTPMLEHWGLQVLAAADADEALETIAEEPIDLVLMDVNMPDPAACDTIRSIRALETQTQVGVIAMIADRQGDGGANCREHGVAELLHKPFTPEQLKEAVARQLAAAHTVSRDPR